MPTSRKPCPLQMGPGLLLLAAFLVALLLGCAPGPSSVDLVGFRVPVELLEHRARAGAPVTSSNERSPGNAPLWGAFGCADVESYSDIPLLDPSSQALFSDMVGGVCGQINFLTGQWFGGKCTAVCTAPGDWCAELKLGVLVDSSVGCNTCATSYPPAGPMDKILACAADPNNTAP